VSRTFRIEPFWRVILREFDVSAESLARRAGLAGHHFANDPIMVDVGEWAALWDALDAEVDEADLALELGRYLTLDMFDPAVLAAFCSANLRQAATRLQLHKRLVGPCRLLVEEDRGLTISCEVVGLPMPPRLWGAGELVSWVALARHTTQRRVVPVRVTMPVEVNGRSELGSYFGVPVTHGPRYELVFSTADADREFLTTDPVMWSFFEPVLRRRSADLDERTSTAERVGAALVELLPSGRSQVGHVASALGASARTIQRRLGEEGTTYREVLDHTRAQLATHYLTRTQITTAEVAFLIGYDDPNSLYPAFRTWTGMTPRALRDGAHLPS
ncbi:MAG: AraC family transcriptional regulator ligand-binding domain-containing protein, partial [Actinomycetota bacterium]